MVLAKDPFNVIIGGVGGQGNVVASQILGQTLVDKGYVITIGETYGASQRGGAVMSHLRVSARNPCSPLISEGQCDLLVSLEPVEGLRVLGSYGNPGVITLTNTRPIFPMGVISGEAPYPELPEIINKIRQLSSAVWVIHATEIALEMGDPIYSNMVMLGALSTIGVLPIDRKGFQMSISELLPSQRLIDNLKAFDRGAEAVERL
jgi:indolepyruvate ferredoxin oxidoreductase beta subunit